MILAMHKPHSLFVIRGATYARNTIMSHCMAKIHIYSFQILCEMYVNYSHTFHSENDGKNHVFFKISTAWNVC